LSWRGEERNLACHSELVMERRGIWLVIPSLSWRGEERNLACHSELVMERRGIWLVILKWPDSSPLHDMTGNGQIPLLSMT